jgi:hypothetical protein
MFSYGKSGFYRPTTTKNPYHNLQQNVCFRIKIDGHYSIKVGGKWENIKGSQLLIKHNVSFKNWTSKTGKNKKKTIIRCQK